MFFQQFVQARVHVQGGRGSSVGKASLKGHLRRLTDLSFVSHFVPKVVGKRKIIVTTTTKNGS